MRNHMLATEMGKNVMKPRESQLWNNTVYLAMSYVRTCVIRVPVFSLHVKYKYIGRIGTQQTWTYIQVWYILRAKSQEIAV